MTTRTNDTTPTLTLDLPPGRRFDLIRIREYLPLGVRVTRFAVEAVEGVESAVVRRFQRYGRAAAGELERPADYRGWVFLTSGLGMTYGPNAPDGNRPAPFSNVFVNPEAYAAFVKSGHWPDGTVFALEIRRAEENVSINAGGRTQGAMLALGIVVGAGRHIYKTFRDNGRPIHI